jgi:hypothetical protein
LTYPFKSAIIKWYMADQDAQDINQMMSATADSVVKPPKKSKFLWVVLACVVVGVGLGVVVYQQSLKPPIKPSVSPKPTAVGTKPSPVATAVTPGINLVEAEPKTVSFPKAGQIRAYYIVGGWMPLGIILKNGSVTKNLTIPEGAPTTLMKVFDTGYILTGPTTLTMDTFLGSDATKLSIGWAKPAANKCGFNGFGVVDITPYINFATEQAGGEPIVSVQCWGDYSPNPEQTDAKDFNDYQVIWSYTPGASPIASATPAASASVRPSSSPSPSPSLSSSPSPSRAASPSPSPTLVASPTPPPSPRVTMPDTSEGTPVTGVFEVTVGTVSVGLILVLLGLFGLLVL